MHSFPRPGRSEPTHRLKSRTKKCLQRRCYKDERLATCHFKMTFELQKTSLSPFRLTPSDVFLLHQTAVSSSSIPLHCPHSTSTITDRHTKFLGTRPTELPPELQQTLIRTQIKDFAMTNTKAGGWKLRSDIMSNQGLAIAQYVRLYETVFLIHCKNDKHHGSMLRSMQKQPLAFQQLKYFFISLYTDTLKIIQYMWISHCSKFFATWLSTQLNRLTVLRERKQ